MITYKFLIATDDVPGLPGLRKGDAVIPVTYEILDGGYEYDVYHHLLDGSVRKVRTEHRESMEEAVVEGECMHSIIGAIRDASEAMNG